MSQAKVQQLYKLDRLLQEESGTLHSLQQDKVSINICVIAADTIFLTFKGSLPNFKNKIHTVNSQTNLNFVLKICIL